MNITLSFKCEDYTYMHVNLKFVLDYYFEAKVTTHLHRCPLGKYGSRDE